ncbi:hypothetical protein GCM10011344_10340 [Dokdonia pacifica]|uniref:Uncharacterized protein n=1 Tax=Dokdonia pacifica TaxID=1627892 RepID=A0A238YM18_9FLAO|nr:hypothetical protein [Dokdonia pacifica]GGG11540.1 hypothetical protein GCM10011344_10340 [Dokdonia pacifica]SNR71751.1 hypothetical protein SAMN06265376_102161 [Dokdonia pacifica]
MLKKISSVKGAQNLSQTAQKEIAGGRPPRNICHSDAECTYPQRCIACICTAPGDPV